MAVKIDDWQNLRKQLAEQGQDIPLFIENCTKELSARLLRKVIKRTPVGKKTVLGGPKTISAVGVSGKKQNFLSKNAAILEQYWKGYQGGTLRRGWTGGKDIDPLSYVNSLPVQKTGEEYSVQIVNPVEYASYVEYGHRQKSGRYVAALGKRLKSGWVEGKYMLTNSEKEINKIAPKLVEKRAKELLEGAFNGK